MAIRQSETEGPGKNKEHVLRDTAPSRDCQRASFQHAEVRGRVFSEEQRVGRKRKKAEQRENTQAGTQAWEGWEGRDRLRWESLGVTVGDLKS